MLHAQVRWTCLQPVVNGHGTVYICAKLGHVHVPCSNMPTSDGQSMCHVPWLLHAPIRGTWAMGFGPCSDMSVSMCHALTCPCPTGQSSTLR